MMYMFVLQIRHFNLCGYFIFKCFLILPIIYKNISCEITANLEKQWQSSNFGYHLATKPLIFQDTIMIAAADGELISLSSHDGHPVYGDAWPVYYYKEHFFSAPIMYDIDSDGKEEVLFFSHQGFILVFSTEGVLKNSFKLPNIYLKKSWLKNRASLLYNEIETFLEEKSFPDNVKMTPQLYGNPLLHDLKQRGTLTDLIFGVNYQYNVMNDTFNDAPTAVLSTVIVFDLRLLSVKAKFPLELSQPKKSKGACFIFDSPVVHDLSIMNHGLEVIVATACGKVHVISCKNGAPITGFPFQHKLTFYSAVPTFKNRMEGRLSTMVLASMDGDLVKLNYNGALLWQLKLRVRISPILTMHMSNSQVLLFTSENGMLFLVHGLNGTVVDKFPLKLSNFSLLTEPTLFAYQSVTYLLLVDNGGYGHILSLVTLQHSVVYIGETSYVGFTVAQDNSIYLPTTDGILIKFGISFSDRSNLNATQSKSRLVSIISKKEFDIMLLLPEKNKISGNYFYAPFQIKDDYAESNSMYEVKAWLYNSEVSRERFSGQGRHTLFIETDQRPISSRLRLSVARSLEGSGGVSESWDSGGGVQLAANVDFVLELPLLLLAPFVCASFYIIGQLLLHESDVLPRWR